ncbi:MAG: ABC transporter permease [Planctomycetes bacterium]|nr:ABC transporter permease [Planctomycetota bacterium]
MNLFITIRIALRSLLGNKVRSALTMLGIIIGISAVIAVIAVGQGATVMIKTQINSLGQNLMMVWPGSSYSGGSHFGAGTKTTLTADDVAAMLKECALIKQATPFVRAWGRQLIYGQKNWQAGVEGVNQDYPQMRSWEPSRGAFFTESDVRNAAKVCVIGATVEKELFSGEATAESRHLWRGEGASGDDPVGKTIRIKNMPFRVIGVMEKKGTNAFGQDQDDIVLAPWTTVSKVLQGSAFNNIDRIIASVVTIESMEAARTEVTDLLRQRHNIAPGAEDDFTIGDVTELTKTITSTSTMMTLLLAIIASISLVVGGIGIMNIMLVSVTERTKEIGLRMAVGARAKDILLQFLVEAVVLAGIGGGLGIALGAGAAEVLSRVTSWPVVISAGSVLLAVLFSGAVGVFFGLYPAWRAARLNPIEALRYE